MRDRAGLACCVAVLLLAPGAARGQEAVPPDLSFAAADRDGDGAVDEGELGLDLADAFLGLDRDGDLVLTRAEAGAAVGGLGALDADGDDRLDFAEVAAAKRRAFAAADRDGDGRLTAAEHAAAVAVVAAGGG